MSENDKEQLDYLKERYNSLLKQKFDMEEAISQAKKYKRFEELKNTKVLFDLYQEVKSELLKVDFTRTCFVYPY